MQDHRSSIKRPSAKHQPKGLTILYEDNHILVVDKGKGLLTIGTENIEIVLLTGRKHQIRVHFAEMDHPVAGDKIYGKEEEKGIKRLALHSFSLTLRHPVTNKEIIFEKELPSFFKTCM
jgi:23S rRNA-/tRNA-specific pseudouridylate synthase